MSINTGDSTAVLARSVGIELTLNDFQKVSDRVPYLADLKPSGRYVMEDLHKVGGVPAVQKFLLDAGLIDGSCMTVTGKTLAENLATVNKLKEGQDVIRPLDQPIKPTGHISILYGNLAKEGAVAKITGGLCWLLSFHSKRTKDTLCATISVALSCSVFVFIILNLMCILLRFITLCACYY